MTEDMTSHEDGKWSRQKNAHMGDRHTLTLTDIPCSSDTVSESRLVQSHAGKLVDSGDYEFKAERLNRSGKKCSKRNNR